MSYCKKCGVLYDSKMGVCPKCGVETPPEDAAPEAPKNVRIRQWIGIVIGIPLFTATLYFVIRALYGLLD